MDLSPVTTDYTAADEKRWLASTHGTDSLETVTLDLAGGSFDDYIVADPRIAGRSSLASGLPIGKGTGTLYVLAGTAISGTDTDTDGGGADTDTDGPTVYAECEGHLFETVLFGNDSDAAGGSLFHHGVVNNEYVPVADFDGSTDGAPAIRYRG